MADALMEVERCTLPHQVRCYVEVANQKYELNTLIQMRKYIATAEGPNRLGVRELLQRYADEQWVADHMMPGQAAESVLDCFRRAVRQELELLAWSAHNRVVTVKRDRIAGLVRNDVVKQPQLLAHAERSFIVADPLFANAFLPAQVWPMSVVINGECVGDDRAAGFLNGEA